MRTTEGTIPVRRPDYREIGGDIRRYYVVDHPEQWSTIPEPYHDRLSEAIDDLGDSIVRIDYNMTKTGPAAELVGITNSLMALHDVLKIYGDMDVIPPALFIATQKTLTHRRDDLRQGQHPKPQP